MWLGRKRSSMLAEHVPSSEPPQAPEDEEQEDPEDPADDEFSLLVEKDQDQADEQVDEQADGRVKCTNSVFVRLSVASEFTSRCRSGGAT